MASVKINTNVIDARNEDIELSSSIKTKFQHNKKIIIKSGYYAGYKGIVMNYKQTLNGIIYEIKCDELKDTIWIDETNIKKPSFF